MFKEDQLRIEDSSEPLLLRRIRNARNDGTFSIKFIEKNPEPINVNYELPKKNELKELLKNAFKEVVNYGVVVVKLLEFREETQSLREENEKLIRLTEKLIVTEKELLAALKHDKASLQRLVDAKQEENDDRLAVIEEEKEALRHS